MPLCRGSWIMRRAVIQTFHWGWTLHFLSLCTLTSVCDHLLQKEVLWWGLCFFHTQMQSYCGKQHDFFCVRSTAPKLEPPTPNLSPCNSASKETGIGFTKPKLFSPTLSEKNSNIQNKAQAIYLKKQKQKCHDLLFSVRTCLLCCLLSVLPASPTSI